MVEVRRVRVLNAWVETFDTESFLATISQHVNSGEQIVVANHNVNSLTIFQHDEKFREFFEISRHCFVDGMGVLAISKLEGTGVRAVNRIAVLDWIWKLLALAEAGEWRVTHLGSTPDTIAAATDKILAERPKLDLTMLDGFFDHQQDSEGNQARLAEVKASAPDILLVGMGMPLQEHWLVDNLSALPNCVIITVGGIMGFLGGDRKTAPRWMGRLGIEWLFRVATEPRRLTRRYTIEPLELAPVIGHHLAERVRRRQR
jgi:N-acetylglucosaminyldiphosphoundecaprenol N-acetyl-beta-D-mannosaminyltransferase